jgi:hypothetical protein
MSKYMGVLSIALLLSAAAVQAEQMVVAIDGKPVSINYSAPATRNRAAASFHTDADLAFKGVNVPKGDYTLYILADGLQWQLAVNKATGAKAATYDAKMDIGRVPMTMSKPAVASDACKIALTKSAALAAKLEIVWNNAAAAVSFHLDRGGTDSEW